MFIPLRKFYMVLLVFTHIDKLHQLIGKFIILHAKVSSENFDIIYLRFKIEYMLLLA